MNVVVPILILATFGASAGLVMGRWLGNHWASAATSPFAMRTPPRKDVLG